MTRILETSPAPWKVLDVNLRPPHFNRDVLEELIAAATALKLSEDELGAVGRELDIGDEPRALFGVAPGLRYVCITRGERGASLIDSSGARRDDPPPAVDVVNTVGAGDAFTAGLIAGLVEAQPPDAVLARAQAWAASVLAKPGGMPDHDNDRDRAPTAPKGA
jgi:fructokinase